MCRISCKAEDARTAESHRGVKVWQWNPGIQESSQSNQIRKRNQYLDPLKMSCCYGTVLNSVILYEQTMEEEPFLVVIQI